MAGSVNKVILVGNLGKDPEVRFGPDGGRIVTFNMATSENWKDRTSGERKERTEWHRVVVFNDKLGEICEKYTKKGSKVYIEGQLQTRKWTDQQGQERYTTEVVLSKFRGEMTLLDSKGASSGSDDFDTSSLGGESSYGSTASMPSLGASAPASFSELNDEVPF